LRIDTKSHGADDNADDENRGPCFTSDARPLW
jgi:hypothetical protein